MDEPCVERSFDSPHIALRCSCGWEGTDADIEDWTVEADRAIRNCPGCGEAVMEWGALTGLEGVRTIARGPLREAIAAADAGDPE